ncbi:MAG: hypothetical protein GWO08_00995, partial [Gammaproteobacteria bacterium]|nr:hypothetical protein [Gammaproteobacteria bacterium]
KKKLFSGLLLGFLGAGFCYLYGVPYAGECMSFQSTHGLEKKLEQHVKQLSETIGERHYQAQDSL